MPQLHTLIARLRRELDDSGCSEALLSVQWIVQEVLGIGRVALVADRNREVEPEAVRKIERMAERRKSGEPIQYIVGYTEFLGYKVEVRPGVLIPRPETEELVCHALDVIPSGRSQHILDIGTGSGCIAMAIKLERPECAVTAIDLSAEALAIARRNFDVHQINIETHRVDASSPRLVDLLGTNSFDVIVSNPPYISYEERDSLQIEVRDFEPPEALFADSEGTAVFESMLPHVSNLLRPGGQVFFEIHADRSALFCRKLVNAGFADIEVRADLAGRPRVLSARVKK